MRTDPKKPAIASLKSIIQNHTDSIKILAVTKMKYLTRKDVINAHSVISRDIIRTPLIEVNRLSNRVSKLVGRDNAVRVFLKCENMQKTNSFKYRGALHCMLKLRDEQLRQGILTYSTGNSAHSDCLLNGMTLWASCVDTLSVGNHAQAIIHAASVVSSQRGIRIPLTIVMACNAAKEKLEAVKALGARIIISNSKHLNDCRRMTSQLQQLTGGYIIGPSDHPDVILGQGTVGLEASDQLEKRFDGSLDAIVAPSGGGGLLAGLGIYYQGSKTDVFGTEPAVGGPCLMESIRIGRRIENDGSIFTIADGLRSAIGEYTWTILRDPCYVKQVFTASESQIKNALLDILITTGLLVEPSAAVPVACLLYNPQFAEMFRQGRVSYMVGVVLSGGNTPKSKFS